MPVSFPTFENPFVDYADYCLPYFCRKTANGDCYDYVKCCTCVCDYPEYPELQIDPDPMKTKCVAKGTVTTTALPLSSTSSPTKEGWYWKHP